MSSRAASTSKKNVHIHWFRHQDLRLHDNPALQQSIQSSKDEGSGIVPIFCFDPRFVTSEDTKFGSPKCGVLRAKFILEAVQNLRHNLESNGSGLVIAHGKTEDIMSKLCQEMNNNNNENLVPNVICQEEIASEELAVDKQMKRILKKYRGSLDTVWGSALYDIDDLPFNDGVYGMPDTFTPFRNKMEKKCQIGNPIPTPSKSNLALPTNKAVLDAIQSIPNCSLTYMPTLKELGYSKEDIQSVQSHDERGVMPFKGGETAALARVQDYIFDKDRLKIYFDTRNGMLGADYSTKFSPWLAHGCLSPRYVAKECKRYEEETGIVNKSTYWVVFELLWRDFFRFFSVKQGNAIFFLDGTLGKEARGSHPNSRRWGLPKKQLQAWKEGQTGYPLVDANMRELAATGFMSNRGRQNVASFLAIEMNCDWRYGADHFESLLLDYDVYSNWGNWCSAAGMTGGRLNRFNIVKQSKDYDKEGEYVRHWIPELKDVPTDLVHEPWKMSKDQQNQFGCRLGVDYPNPIVKPTAPNPYRGKGKNGGGRGGQQNRGKRNGNNPNRGRGQRADMKSLKQGGYNFK
jgi:deoxyribodipyrimidine photo-lyase